MIDWNKRRVWTSSQIARELQCAPRTVRGWCENGRLPATRTLGGHYRVGRDALRVFTPSATGRAQEAA